MALPATVTARPRTARFNAPVGVALDASGRIIVADTYNDRIRVIDPDGQVRTLAGGDDGGDQLPSAVAGEQGRARSPSAAGHADGPGPDARFDTPCGVAVDEAGRVLVADTGNGLIRAIGLDGVVTTVPLPVVGLERPIAVAPAANGDVYVVDERGALVLLPAQGDARLIAGGAPGLRGRRRQRRAVSTALSHRAVGRARKSAGRAGSASRPSPPLSSPTPATPWCAW